MRGLAGTLWFFGLFFDGALAERLMRTAWPMLWLLPTMAGTAAIAWRLAGREAALIALLLAVVGLPAFHQFRPGRIDHHNVQIALSVLAVAATVWSDRVRWAAVAAGAVTGLAMAIGLECLPYLIVCARGLRGALCGRSQRPRVRPPTTGWHSRRVRSRRFFVIVGPDHWTRGVCDDDRDQLGRARRRSAACWPRGSPSRVNERPRPVRLACALIGAAAIAGRRSPSLSRAACAGPTP